MTVMAMADVTGHKQTLPADVKVERCVDVDRSAYQNFVASHPHATAYHNIAWLDAVEQAYGHPCWVVTAWRGHRLVAVLPVCQLRRIGGGSLVSLPFCDLAGPLYETAEGESALKTGIRTLLSELGASTLEVRRRGPALCEQDIAELEHLKSNRKVSMVASLPESSERLFASYKPKLRSQIRKAEKNGLTAEVVTGTSGIDDFYPVFAANMRRLGSPVHGREWFDALTTAFDDRLLVGIVRLENEVVGAGIVLVQGKTACIPWASTVAEYNHLATNMLLYWQLLSHVADYGCRQFDFGRSSFGEGTYRFKKQWGAEPVALDWQQWQPDGSVLQSPATEPGLLAKKLRSWIEACWRRLPLQLANRLGPKLRKHISL